MLHRDFFAFCKSLEPKELKQLGALSSVLHIEKDKPLYSPGDPGDTLYIINRGVLELLPPNSRENIKGILLERGDVVGEVEVFGDMPRTQLVRARGPASLQCFPKANFPELLQHFPGFFAYICEQMANRLRKERDLAVRHGSMLELAGQLSNFDLPTVYQTLISSGQTGELTICDEKAQTMGAFYFEAGRLRAGRFRHLSGDEAIFQLFMSDHLSGSFQFAADRRPAGDVWIETCRIDRNDNEVLLRGLQYRDELDDLKRSLEKPGAKLRPRSKYLEWDYASYGELQGAAIDIWRQLALGPRTIDELYQNGAVCELKIHQIISELLRSCQISFINPNDRPSGIVTPPVPAAATAG